MTERSQKRLSSFRQRGFWLRCFLEKGLISVCLLLSFCKCASANECTYKPVYIRHLEGHVSYATGGDAHGARITVRSSAKTVLQSTADQMGNFQITVPRGQYDLVVESPGFLPSVTHVHVGFGVKSLFRRSFISLRLDVTRVC
jgi:hypothetical protein